jgi:putative transposase
MGTSGEFQLRDRENPSAGVHIHFHQSTVVLLTVTTEGRKPWLADPACHRHLHEVWSAATAWLVGDYLLMPDHLHALCAPRDLKTGIEKWIRFWKREFQILHGRPECRFQPRGWHHRLRSGESHFQKWIYIQENPVRKGLVNRMEDWPFKGRVFDLIWSGK